MMLQSGFKQEQSVGSGAGARRSKWNEQANFWNASKVQKGVGMYSVCLSV